MRADRVVELCTLSARAIREDIALIEEGALKWNTLTDLDVSRQQVSRMRAVVSYLQEIIDGCGCDCASAASSER